jgi:hypothetical protein
MAKPFDLPNEGIAKKYLGARSHHAELRLMCSGICPLFEIRAYALYFQSQVMLMMKLYLMIRPVISAAALVALLTSVGQAASGQSAEPAAAYAEPLDATTLDDIKGLFKQLMISANKHDVDAIRQMFWNSPSALLVAKSVDPAEGNWAGFWGIDAVAQKIRDIAAAGTAELYPDFSKLKAVGITADVAETYAPLKIAVSYGGQDPVPKPFLMILNWVKTPDGWKIASEIILPVPPAPPAKG